MINKRYPRTILATACIPWDESHQFMEDMFRKHIKDLKDKGIHHIYLFGTAGEGYAVSDAQFDEIVHVFVQEMQGPDLHPMVGLVSLSFETMSERLRKAYAAGIRDFQFSLPSWGPLADRELVDFVHALCDPYPDCRFLHYNLMRSKRLLQVDEYVQLANDIPNFAGAKFTTKDTFIVHQLMETDSPLQFFLGELGFGYAHMIGGECGLLISIGNSHIARAQKFYQAALNRDLSSLAGFQTEFSGLLKGLFQSIRSGHMDGAYDKVFCKLIDSQFPLRLLPPYESSTEEQYAAYQTYLQQHYPQWLE
ncbi:Dihydrodipicolinate synthase/N-acetylneuraminate lyase [Virgibacillus subterraneus]|uniref:Dihydrodipicolinate synthase/N-acetylneuraminate lyase n=1 Tax=Virgibacillus subterraneus TaxID=621109 RepID=A0A1H9G755_9BACI|nr:dihydrodipicolinate synthase family protein [Virgibacillus subterraneus]SEQ45966.1 Dihydrodipicolinate synthase/N-acetylneuraminate lyase [Virgibacillus subterraneus]